MTRTLSQWWWSTGGQWHERALALLKPQLPSRFKYAGLFSHTVWSDALVLERVGGVPLPPAQYRFGGMRVDATGRKDVVYYARPAVLAFTLRVLQWWDRNRFALEYWLYHRNVLGAASGAPYMHELEWQPPTRWMLRGRWASVLVLVLLPTLVPTRTVRAAPVGWPQVVVAAHAIPVRATLADGIHIVATRAESTPFIYTALARTPVVRRPYGTASDRSRSLKSPRRTPRGGGA